MPGITNTRLLSSATEEEITDIKAVTDLLPDAGALSSISDETDKIDEAVTDGLLGVSGSVGYRAHEIDRHIHSYERWACAAVVPNGEIHVADRIGSIVGATVAFQMDGGNNTWGSWLQILGSADTPAEVGNVKFDLHKIEIVAVERQDTSHFIQIAFGASGAVAFAADAYTEFVFHPQSVQGRPAPVTVQDRRIDTGTKAWTRCWAVGQNTGTLDFFIGFHEYEG